jgi:protoporphyrinogen oxidase
VNVVNLYYSSPTILPIRGFGYLIPRSIPFEQNPERALGVVFDSEIVPSGQDTVPGTKLTVMLGGHWWDGWNSIPNSEESISMAKSILARHMGITTEPTVTLFSSQKECIPQYTVGHSARLKQAHRDLLRRFKGRLKVAGNSYTGVGVNDCIKAARDIAEAVGAGDWRDKTGLEGFESDVAWVEFTTDQGGAKKEDG